MSHRENPIRLLFALVALVAGCDHDKIANSGGASDAGAFDLSALASAPDLLPAGGCEVLDEKSCFMRLDCHALFVDNGQLCDCAQAGCCTSFVRCTAGPAHCSPVMLCGKDDPYCDGPWVVAYSQTCSEGCVRADECSGCFVSKLEFTQADGCQNDGSLEFCLPQKFEQAAKLIAPSLHCTFGGGRAMCNSSVERLCFFPTGDAATCNPQKGRLTDAAYDQLCRLSTLPQVRKIVRTILE